jgi:hypothetical protein
MSKSELHFFSYLLAYLSIASSVAQAYGPCDADEEKFCAAYTHQETTQACLHKKVEQLSPDCQTYVRSREAEWKKTVKSWEQVKKACTADLNKHCQQQLKDEDEKIKALQVCLMSEGQSLEPACKKELNRHIGEFQPGIKPVP